MTALVNRVIKLIVVRSISLVGFAEKNCWNLDKGYHSHFDDYYSTKTDCFNSAYRCSSSDQLKLHSDG